MHTRFYPIPTEFLNLNPATVCQLLVDGTGRELKVYPLRPPRLGTWWPWSVC